MNIGMFYVMEEKTEYNRLEEKDYIMIDEKKGIGIFVYKCPTPWIMQAFDATIAKPKTSEDASSSP